MTERYALMWSGGKDSALAVSRAQSLGLDVTKLLNFYDVTTGRVRFHATTVTMLQVQAEALGIELRAVGSTWADMDVRFSQELTTLRSDGFDGVVFGDIHLGDVRAWYEERVTAAGLRHVEPIWGESPPKLVEEFVEAGGRAVITCVDLSRLDSSWLGRLIDERFWMRSAKLGSMPAAKTANTIPSLSQGRCSNTLWPGAPGRSTLSQDSCSST